VSAAARIMSVGMR